MWRQRPHRERLQEIGENVRMGGERGSSTVLPSRHQLRGIWCLVPAWHTVCLEGGMEWCWGCRKSSWVLGGQGCCPLETKHWCWMSYLFCYRLFWHQKSKPGLFVTLFSFLLLLLLKHWKDLMRRWPNNWVLCHPYTSQVGIHWSTRVMDRNGWLKMTTSKIMLYDLYSQNFWFHSGLSARYQAKKKRGLSDSCSALLLVNS